MCLLTEDKKLREAEEDITCYKVLLYKPDYDEYCSPYFPNFRWDVTSGKTIVNTEKIDKTSWETAVNPLLCENKKYYEVAGGVFHTYKDPEQTAKILFLFEKRYGDSTFPIVKFALATCVIPKGTKYYLGRTANKPYQNAYWTLLEGDENYASKKLIIKDVTFSVDQEEQEENHEDS